MSATDTQTKPSSTETTSTGADFLATLGEAAVKVLDKFSKPVQDGAARLRKIASDERSAKVALGKTLHDAFEAGMTLAPKGSDARKTYETALREQLISWCGEAPRTGEPYQWATLKQMMVSSQVIAALPSAIRGSIGVDTAATLASIPDDEREAFVQKRIDEGESLAPRPMRAAAKEYLIENGHRTAPTFKGRIGKGVKKHRGEQPHTEVLAAVKVLNPKNDATRQDAIEAVAAFAIRVAGLDVKSDGYKIALAVTEQLLNPKSATATDES